MALKSSPPSPVSFLEASPGTFSGVPALLTPPFGKGFEEASNVIRQASQELDSYSPAVDSDLKDTLVTDYGTLV